MSYPSHLRDSGRETIMTNKLLSQPVHAKESDYTYGRHMEWECVLHEEETKHYEATGQFWSYDYRKRWIERFFTITPYAKQHVVRPCGVCSEEVSKNMLYGDVGRVAFEQFKAHVRQLSRKLASKTGNYRRHIDVV